MHLNLRLQPSDAEYDLLLNIDTLPVVSAIYLVHHRSNDAFYYYIDRHEIGPWSPDRSGGDASSALQLEFVWQDGQQQLLADGVEVLSSRASIQSRVIRRIEIGHTEAEPDRDLQGDLLIEDFTVHATTVP